MATRQKSQRVHRESLSDVVYKRMREAILRGDLPDGSTLSQAQLAERYGVSSIPVREALRRLQAESLVVATPFRSFIVRKISAEQILELVDMRTALEDLVLARRGPFTTDEIADLRSLNQKMLRGAGQSAWFQLDREFHQLLAGSNTLISETINDVRDLIRKYSDTLSSDPPGRQEITDEHEAIIDALEHGEIDLARSRLREHLMQSRAFVIRRLEHGK